MVKNAVHTLTDMIQIINFKITQNYFYFRFFLKGLKKNFPKALKL